MIVNNIERDYIIHNDREIKGFFGEWRFLCNFHKCPVEFEGVIYPSTENAYMAAKTLDLGKRKEFENIEPFDAKKLGREVELRSDWEEIKFDVMYSVVLDKFNRHVDLRDKLLSTGDKYLEETNHWNDRIWGVCNGEGENNLGKTLMSIREKLLNLK